MSIYSYVCHDCLYIYMWLSLLQAWVFQQFRGIDARDEWGGYRDYQHPCAMMYLPLKGMSTPDEYR